MTTVEPPHGGEDLAGQVSDIEHERDQLARERAEFARDQALVRQRRFTEDQAAHHPEVFDPAEPYPPVDAPAPSRAAPAVIDPDGTEFELTAAGVPQLDGRGNPIPVGEYDRDDDGLAVLDSEGNPVPPWPYETVELHGRTIQVRKPNAAALQAFSMGVSKYTPDKIRTEMVSLFVQRHISERSYGELLVKMMDPDDPFTIEHFGNLMEKIATIGSARPTGPSRA
ncbi:hypothetical protein [Nocardia miyunensis]|uniref:hypothetical protein n=1 Tax=Nocardia miyunensis TaxID=282684 RepID=UPI00082B827C|nr:hypothetical protein [Nocardia miyunensis]